MYESFKFGRIHISDGPKDVNHYALLNVALGMLLKVL
jgi:hypothetical protein